MTRRVCFLGYELHPPWHEGTRVLTRHQMDALAAGGTPVSAVSTRGPGDRAWDRHDIRYVRETSLGRLIRATGRDPNATDVLLWAKLARALRRQVAAMDADLVHAGFASHTVFSIVCDLPPSVPFVAQLFGKLFNPTLVRLLGTLNRVDAYVTCSPADVERLRAIGVSGERVFRLPPAVPVYEGDSAAGRTGLDVGDAFLVGYLGNTDRSRFPPGFASQLNAFAADGDTEAVVITKSLAQPSLRDLGNLSVIERSLSDAEKADVLAGADAWVFPFEFDDPRSAPIIDPPMSVLEAMAAGRPVVTTRSLSLPDHVEDGETGWLVEPGDYNAAMSRLEMLRDDRVCGDRLGEAARDHVSEAYNPSRVARTLEAVYDAVMDE